jgi:hypothetical protein
MGQGVRPFHGIKVWGGKFQQFFIGKKFDVQQTTFL